jgi:hypothetical protein
MKLLEKYKFMVNYGAYDVKRRAMLAFLFLLLTMF